MNRIVESMIQLLFLRIVKEDKINQMNISEREFHTKQILKSGYWNEFSIEGCCHSRWISEWKEMETLMHFP